MRKRKYLGLALALGIGASLCVGSQASAAAFDWWWEDPATEEVLVADECFYYVTGQTAAIAKAKEIKIKTTTSGAITPTLLGFGMYVGNTVQDYSGKKVSITTEGSKADAVQVNINASKVTFGDNLNIKTTGASADGINLTENTAGGRVFIGNNATIDAYAMGIRVNNSITNNVTNAAQVGDNLTVTTTQSGANFLDGTGYGIYAGLRTLQAGSQKADSWVFIGKNSTVETNGSSAHAVYANNSGKIVLGNNTDVTVNNSSASALRAESLTGATGNTTITLLGDTTVTAKTDGKTGQYAMYAKGNAGTKGIISNVEADQTLDDFGNQDLLGNTLTISNNQRVFKVTGDFYADTNGLINLDMTNGTEIVGKSTLANTGEINFKIDGSQSFWKMTDNSTLTNLTLTDGATVYLSDETDLATRQTLTINGDYHGDGGKFVFNGVLAGDGSPVDFINIAGDVSGTTKVGVKNLGGLGEKTVNGIEIIRVAGDSPTGSFTQDGRIVAGAYDYFVTKGDEQGNNTNNWYLTNRIPLLPEEEQKPKPVRPEGGAYLGNAYAANNLFQLTLHDRIGEVALLDEASLQDKSKNIWARMDTRKVSMKEKSDQIDLKQDYDALQVGFDLIRKKENNRMYLLGIMGGYGTAKTNAKGQLWDAKGSIDGYSLGLYGTIYDEHKDQSGKYVDAWILWNDFDGTVKGDGLASEKYGLDGITASIEAGYDQLAMRHETNPNHNLWLKWQAQVTYQGVKADRHQEVNGTIVGKNDDNIQTRLGVRLYKKMMGESGRWHQPYAEVNWHHNTSTYDISMDGDRDFSTYGMRNVFELKLGYEGQISKNMQLWGNIFGGLGTQGSYTYGARVGLKYTF